MMKRPLKISAVIFGVLVLIAIAWVALVLFSYSGTRSQAPEPVYSPDKSKVIIPIVNSNKDDSDSYLLVYLEIQDTQSGKALFQVQTRASDRMRWSLEWVNDHTVKLDSSDIGSYCWMEGTDEIWKETTCP